MKSAPENERVRMRVVHGRFPGWVALLLLAPAGLLFLFSLAAVLAAGFAGALILPLVWRRLAPPARGEDDCIELRPDEFRTIRRHDRLPPP